MTDQIKKLERQINKNHIEFKQALLDEWSAIQEIYFNFNNHEKADECQSHINRLSHDIAELRRAEDKRKQPQVHY